MKKIVLLIIGTIFLSGCSSSNGVVTKEDTEKLKPSQIASLEAIKKEQETISYIPDDVKLFLEELKKADNKVISNDDFNYISRVREELNYLQAGEFIYKINTGIYSYPDIDEDFSKLIDVLDKTIAKGIKLYVDKNLHAKLDEKGISSKIGRAWITIKPRQTNDSSLDSPDNLNDVKIKIQIKDIKNEKYKQIVDSIRTDDLLLDIIRIGDQQNLIRLNNMEFTEEEEGLRKKQPAINYELFVKDDEIQKARISMVSSTDVKINDADLKLLEKLSEALDFKNGDIKELQEIRSKLKNSENGKYNSSSEKFNFRYRSLKKKEYDDSTRNMVEVIIEKK